MSAGFFQVHEPVVDHDRYFLSGPQVRVFNGCRPNQIAGEVNAFLADQNVHVIALSSAQAAHAVMPNYESTVYTLTAIYQQRTAPQIDEDGS